MRMLNRLSLRAKIALCVALVVLLVGAASALFTRETLSASLREELEERGRSIATRLANRSADHVLRGDFFELHEMIQETRAKSKEVRYVFILDPKGNVIDHTFESGFPMDLLLLPAPEPDQEYRAQLLRTEEGFIRDIAVPVFAGKAGTVHVGMAEAYIDTVVTGAIRALLIATGVALLVGATLAWFLAHLVTRPILRLVGVADAVGGGDLSRRADIGTQDEVGRLGRAFDAMTEQLAARIDELETTNEQLSALNNVATLLNRTTLLDSVLGEILERLLDLVQADAGGILFRGHEGELRYRAHRGLSLVYLESVADLMTAEGEIECLIGSVDYLHPESMTADQGLLFWMDKEGAQAFEGIPLWVNGEMRGALHVARRAQRSFTPRERELLSSVAAQIGTVLANRELLREATEAEALRQLNQMKSDFALRASHELRTPSTAIKGYVETLLRPDMALDRRQQVQIFKDMDAVSDRLNRLLQDVLNVARLESGALDLKKEVLALRPLLQRTARRLRRQNSEQRLVVEFDSNLSKVLGDKDRTEDILENLIANAFKYSPKEGTITVSARNNLPTEEADRISATEPRAEPAEFVTVSVADEGIGISAAEVPKLFQQFYQVRGKGGVRSDGMGIGLFICKSYVEAMGGEIWVESEEGKGSTFSFTIPVLKTSREPHTRRGQPLAEVGRRR